MNGTQKELSGITEKYSVSKAKFLNLGSLRGLGWSGAGPRSFFVWNLNSPRNSGSLFLCEVLAQRLCKEIHHLFLVGAFER